MNRRQCLGLALATTAGLLPRDAWAGSYLNRAAVMLDGAAAERNMVLPRSNDKELLRVVHAIAKARADAGRVMKVPKVVAGAHPHLLLVLENTERAFAAALGGRYAQFVEHVNRARADDRTFRSLIKKLGYTVPKTR